MNDNLSWLLMVTFDFFTPLVATLILTQSFIRYAHKRSLFDIPNDRSAHVIPVPRGGGIVFVSVFMLVWGFSAFKQDFTLEELAVIMGGLVIAALGFWDDRVGLSATIRLFVQILVAITLVLVLGDLPWMQLLGLEPIMPINRLASVLTVVWLINAYNFMDGIDGIAGVEGVFLAAAIGGLWPVVIQNDFASVWMILPAALLGFLFHNWSPARVFMGDVGSAFLGYFFVSMALLMVSNEPKYLAIWLILLGFFLVDTLFTLCVRVWTGQRITQAHSLHAYQKLTQKGWSHRHVCILMIFINLLWLLPCAWLVKQGSILPILGIVVAWLPLVLICFFVKAGWPLHKKNNGEIPL